MSTNTHIRACLQMLTEAEVAIQGAKHNLLIVDRVDANDQVRIAKNKLIMVEEHISEWINLDPLAGYVARRTR